MTALFCDLVGFTPLSESLDAEHVRTLQTTYFERMSALVARFGGRVEKFAGDAVLALFGVPVAHGDDAERALLCALAMLDAIEALAADARERWGAELALRIGINSGEGVSGVLDAGGRRDFSVTGDVINTAARLQAAADPGSIMAGEETMRMARRAIKFGERRDLTLKGKARPVAAYVVLSAADGAARVADISLLTPLVGRDYELDLVAHAWERARAGEGALVYVVGDAGVGKSRLITEALSRCVEASDVPVHWGRCLSYGQGVGLSLIADLLRSITRVHDHEDAEALQRSLSEAVESFLDGESAAARDAAVDVLGEVLGLPPGTSSVSAADPQARRQVLIRSLRALLAGLTAAGPAILVLEDLHWIDAASAAVLTDILADVPGLPLLVVAASRPGWSPVWADWAWPEQLSLRPLDQRHALDLALRLLGGQRLDLPLEQYITERAAGNPFFVEELVRALQEEGAVRNQDGVLHLVASAADRLPTSLTEIVLARLDRLEGEVRDLVQVASVIGRTFAVDLLGRVARQPEAPLTSALAVLLRAEIAFPRQGAPSEYAFRHVTVRDVAYNTLLLRRRQELHAAIAHTISALDPADESVEIVAYHFSQTDEHEQAARWLERAGDRSAAVYANQSAIDHYEECRRRYQRCGAGPETMARVGEKLGTVFSIVAWFDEALEELQAAASLYRAAGDIDAEARASAAISRVHFTRGAPDEAVASVGEIIGRLEWEDEDEVPLAGLAQLYMALVHPLYSLNRFEDALTAAWRAVEVAKARGEERLLTEATVRYGLALQGIGRLNEATRVLADVIPQAERVGDPASLGGALLWSGDVALDQGRPQDAQDHYRKALQLYQDHGNLAETASVLVRLGQVSSVLGAWEEARGHFERAVELVRSISFSHASVAALVSLGEHYLAEGSYDDAARYLEESVVIAERSGQTAQLPYLEIPMAAWDLQDGRASSALERLQPLLHDGRFETATDHRAMQLATRAHVLGGNVDAARSLAERGLEHAGGQTRLPAVLGWLHVLGKIEIAERCHQRAEEHLREALSLAEGIGYRAERARILRTLGEMRSDARAPELREALDVFQSLGATPEAEGVQRTLDGYETPV